jgi:hypothetical protein
VRASTFQDFPITFGLKQQDLVIQVWGFPKAPSLGSYIDSSRKTATTMRTQPVKTLAANLSLALAFLTLIDTATLQAQDSPSGLPEGSSTIIESVTWRITAGDLVALREQTKAAVGQIPEAVIVKETTSLLSVSIPTKQLPALRQALAKLGTVTPAEADPSTPTTLLRLMFVQP